MSHDEQELVLIPVEQKYPKGYIPTEQDLVTFSHYDAEIIRIICHNFSLVGLENAHTRVTKRTTGDIHIHRCKDEKLTFSYDHLDHSVMLSVSDPHNVDIYEEMTAIFLSCREARVLRSMLNKLAL